MTVRGQLVEAASFSAGFRLNIDDGSGRLMLVLFENVLDGMDAAQLRGLKAGAIVTATGRVADYKGAPELIVNALWAGAGPGAGANQYALGALSGNDHNALAQVSGVVKALTPFDNGVDVLLEDATGAQKVRLYRMMEKRVRITPGMRLRVTGRVKASRAKGLWIEVALPGDIEISPAAQMQNERK